MKLRLLVNKIWKDKVGSIILASLIIPTLLLIALGIKSQLADVPFKRSLSEFLTYLNSNMEIKTYWLYIADLALVTWTLYIWKKKNYLGERIQRAFQKNTEELQIETIHPFEQPDKITSLSKQDIPAYFESRMAETFPRAEGLKWYNDPRIAKNKLSLFLLPPYEFKSEKDSPVQPIWFFRGIKNTAILRFERYSGQMCLINNQELKISKLAAFRSDFKNFIYVETEASSPSGINKISKEQIEADIKNNGFSKEYFGLTSDKQLISSEEYWDGFARIGKRFVKLEGAEERSRYLSKFNFIITDHESVLKLYRDGDEYIFREILNKILIDKAKVEDLVDVVKASRWNEYA